eukprot:TRINITY_DN1272_c0_g1_i1.p1 TRINITY_DN1272_c0_g1~~TRINITY_DN1272_c0_g1_i1.p1  ORF type:complete len:194 (+),score=17.54 TRINITY_DN1272_c0_g1_i1:33-584(+)
MALLPKYIEQLSKGCNTNLPIKSPKHSIYCRKSSEPAPLPPASDTNAIAAQALQLTIKYQWRMLCANCNALPSLSNSSETSHITQIETVFANAESLLEACQDTSSLSPLNIDLESVIAWFREAAQRGGSVLAKLNALIDRMLQEPYDYSHLRRSQLVVIVSLSSLSRSNEWHWTETQGSVSHI